MEPEPGYVVRFPSFRPILWLNVPFSLVQPSSHLTLNLYAKRSAHPDILIGTHEMAIPQASQSGSFVENSLSFNQMNISRADIACVLRNSVGGAARSTQPVTLYITVNITPPNPYNGPPGIPTEYDDSLAEATILGHIQFPAPERLLPLSHYQPTETGNTILQSQEVIMSPTATLHRTDEAMERIVPIDRSNTWERALGRIKWVMDTLSPIAEVRVMAF